MEPKKDDKELEKKEEVVEKKPEQKPGETCDKDIKSKKNEDKKSDDSGCCGA